jgi:hypothetical protein
MQLQKSDSIKNLTKALITFHVKVDTIKKDAKNPFFKSSYASLSNILDATNDGLIESGLTIAQFPVGDYGLETILMHESGEWIQASYQMKPVKDDPQGRGSCLSYMRRYSLSAVLLLNIDDDDDGNLATHGTASPYQNTERSWLNQGTPEFQKAMDYIAKGGKIDAIKTKYKIRKEVEELLTSQNQ